MYLPKLKAKKSYYSLWQNFLATADCDQNGKLSKNLVVIECIKFIDKGGDVESHFQVFVCSCDEACWQRELLKTLRKDVISNVDEFKERTIAKYCIQARAAKALKALLLYWRWWDWWKCPKYHKSKALCIVVYCNVIMHS